MIRYFVLATIIVCSCAIVLGGWWAMQPRKRLTVTSVTTTMAPRAERAQKLAYAGRSAPFIATVPWALSVLPECVQQVMSARGSVAYVTARIPPNASEIQSPAKLNYADCKIELSGSSALVHRGEDRLRIPPRVRLYRLRNELFVLREDSSGSELRVYAPR